MTYVTTHPVSYTPQTGWHTAYLLYSLCLSLWYCDNFIFRPVLSYSHSVILNAITCYTPTFNSYKTIPETLFDSSKHILCYFFISIGHSQFIPVSYRLLTNSYSSLNKGKDPQDTEHAASNLMTERYLLSLQTFNKSSKKALYIYPACPLYHI